MVFVNIIDSVPELLYKHNCVIIPGFGGFITNFKHSGFEESRNLISPSTKKVAFNQSLTENDGLLVNSWAQKKGISYKEAFDEVDSFAEFLRERIFSNKSFDFKHIGTFYLNAENKIIFVPYQGLNFLESSYGLYPVKIKPLHVQPVIAITRDIEPEVPVAAEIIEENNYEEPTRVIQFNYSRLLKVASVVLIASVSVLVSYYFINKKQNNVTTVKHQAEQNAAIISIDSNSDKPEETREVKLANLEYVAERQKINEIKSRLDSFSVYNAPKQETYNVVVGYYSSEAAATKVLKSLSYDYSNAKLAEITTEGYAIVVESFYKHTTAITFSVMLKQNGFKNVKIEKQVVIRN